MVERRDEAGQTVTWWNDGTPMGQGRQRRMHADSQCRQAASSRDRRRVANMSTAVLMWHRVVQWARVWHSIATHTKTRRAHFLVQQNQCHWQ
jgi:hypothetical protein